MKVLILSDIHANLSALEAVLRDARERWGDVPIIHLGDIVDYGMRPHQCIELLRTLGKQVLLHLKGNHELALLDQDCSRFSGERGREASRATARILKDVDLSYIRDVYEDSPRELLLKGKRILCVHGDLNDPYWGTMSCEEGLNAAYMPYDYVVSGHTHIRFVREVFHPSEDKDAKRGKKRTVFINPGSVGQPRNHNPQAQYALLDLEHGDIELRSVRYDIEHERSLFDGSVDSFYSERLVEGI